MSSFDLYYSKLIMKSLYILQVTKVKLGHDSFKLLRCLLYYILKTTDCHHLLIEVQFEESDFGQDLGSHP